MPSNSVEFGWGAPPMKEQHPTIPDFEADQFDKDNAAVIRLSVRGLITSSQRDAALKKLTKSIEKEIRTALAYPLPQPNPHNGNAYGRRDDERRP